MHRVFFVLETEDKESKLTINGISTSYNKAIEISEALNCRTSYIFVDFIYTVHEPQAQGQQSVLEFLICIHN